MKHISAIIAENKERAIREGKQFERKCTHCNFPIWTVDAREMYENHFVVINYRGVKVSAILCNSCLSDISNLMQKK